MEFIIFFVIFIIMYEIMKSFLSLVLKDCYMLKRLNKAINSRLSGFSLEVIKLVLIVLAAILIGNLVNYDIIIFGVIEGIIAAILSTILDKTVEN